LPRETGNDASLKTSKEQDMYEVAYTIINAKWQIVAKTKAFKTAKAREKHLDKLREKGVLHEILGYRDPA
jgi:hypothetical protein